MKNAAQREAGEPTPYDNGWREGRRNGMADAAAFLIPKRPWVRRLVCSRRGCTGPEWTAFYWKQGLCTRCGMIYDL